MDPHRRRVRSAGPILVPVLIACLATGCTGSPSSTSAWQSSSERALGAVISGLGTARLAVVQEDRGRLPHSYAVVAVTDAVDTSSKEVATYLVGQPPDRLHPANDVVTRALQTAVALLAEVRVAIASPGLDETAARHLVERIDTARKQLDHLDSTVKRAPGSVAKQ
jgi:outer membrane PBP1 activator LpoA protein